ncbi:MAG: SNF2-related protein [Actinomycetales bacterium]
MADWVDALDEAAIRATVDSGTLARGRDYARRGRVRDLRRLPGELRAEVLGSGHVYRTHVTPYAGRSRRRTFVGTCSCPVGEDCKHVVAVLLTARNGAGPRATGSRSASSPAASRPAAWEDVVSRLLARPDPPGPSVPVAAPPQPLLLLVQVTRTPASARTPWSAWRPVPPVRVVVRAAVQDGADASRTSVVQWPLVAARSGVVEEHRDAVVALYGLFEGSRPRERHHQPGQPIPLDECGPGVWAALQRIVAAGVALTPPRDTHRAVVLAEGPASVALAAHRTSDGGARLSPGLSLDGLVLRADTVVPVGEPAHGVGVVTGGDGTGTGTGTGEHPPGTLVLARLAEPMPDALADLARTGEVIRIPAADVDRFAVDWSPALRRAMPVATDGSLDLPEVSPPRLALDLAWEGPVTMAVRWGFAYRVGERDVRVPLSPVDDGWGAGHRDAAAERQLLTRLPMPPEGPPRAREMQRLGMLDGARFTGAAAMRFVRDDLPRFQAVDGLEVTVTGTPADFREASEPPVVTLAVTDRPDERDWFDLDVTVTVEGEPVRFADLFGALARDEDHLVLDTGVYISLDHPELHRLRELIHEARALQDRPPTGDGLRINRYQADLWAELAALGTVREQSERWSASVRALLDADLVPPPVPAGVHAELRPYQLAGYRWLATLHDHGLGGILADDMGLGKTLQVLSLVAHAVDQGERRPFLVVAPTSVVPAWAQEAARFTPGLAVAAVRRTQGKSGVPVADSAAGAAVVVTSYSLFRLDVEAYEGVEWAGLVLDEAQTVKNHRARTHQLVRKLKVPVKLAVTGTPLENGLMEFWALLSIVAPGLYPSPERFADHVVKPVESGTDPGRLATLRRRVRPLMLRRTKEQVAADLPPKQEQVLEVELAPAHRRVYQTHLQRERQKVLRLIEDPQRNRFEILRSLMLLRRLALDPALVDDAYDRVPATKVDVLLERVREVVDEGHRALVFSQFTGFLRTVRTRLDAAGVPYAYLDGATRDRARRIAEFREGDAPLFLISLKAGGSGLTLTEADYVFLLDPWWNPAVEAQAVDRTHRIGQTRAVMVYRLVATDTIEDKVMALKARKSELFRQVMSEDGALPAGPLTADDVRELLGLPAGAGP